MESRAKLLGHPIHPMLVVLPLGLFIGAVVFDHLPAAWPSRPVRATPYGSRAVTLVRSSPRLGAQHQHNRAASCLAFGRGRGE